MIEKSTFRYIFIILVLALMVMPFITTFNDLLTRAVMSLDYYQYIQNVIVPWEVRLIGVILLPFGFKPAVFGQYLSIGKENPFIIEIAWNCIGWQSLLFFIITAFIGLQGYKYSLLSKLKAFMVGFLGTFLINLFRITLVTLIAYYLGQDIAIFFHDYGSVFVIIGWLFFFWWFSFVFILEEQ